MLQGEMIKKETRFSKKELIPNSEQASKGFPKTSLHTNVWLTDIFTTLTSEKN